MADAEDLIRIGPPTSGVQPAGQDVRAAHRRRAVHGPLPLMHMVVYTDEPSRACRAPNWPGPVGGRAVPAPETGQPCVARLGSEAMGAEEPDVAPAGEAVTRILGAAVRGEPRAAEDLLPLVYDELRRLAAAYMVAGSTGPDPQRHGAGARGRSAAGRSRPQERLGRPPPLFCRSRRGDAADLDRRGAGVSGRPVTAAGCSGGRWTRIGMGSRLRKPTSACWPSTSALAAGRGRPDQGPARPPAGLRRPGPR